MNAPYTLEKKRIDLRPISIAPGRSRALRFPGSALVKVLGLYIPDGIAPFVSVESIDVVGEEVLTAGTLPGSLFAESCSDDLARLDCPTSQEGQTMMFVLRNVGPNPVKVQLGVYFAIAIPNPALVASPDDIIGFDPKPRN